MNTSFKRGLAATAISALAITGVPLLATSASAVPASDQLTPSVVTLLSQANGQASVKNDGTDTTVRLQASAPATVTSVTFAYTLAGGTAQTITTTERNDDGTFSFEWAVPAALVGANVTLSVTGTPTTAGAPAQTDTQATVINAAGAATDSVNLAAGSAKGVFQSPYGSVATEPQNVIVNGTTSAVAGAVDVTVLTGSNAGDTVAAPIAQATGATTGTFRGVLDINGYTYGGSADNLVLGAVEGSDDVESYSLYRQTITSVTAVAANANVPAGGTSAVNVTVLDQQQQPIAGARVVSNAGGAAVLTNANGVATFTQAAGATTFYYADATNDAGFQTALGDQRSADVTVGAFNPTPTAITGASADGAAFDDQEFAAGDLSVQVRDQNGNALTGARQISYRYVVTPFGGGTPVNVPTTGSTTVTTDANGRFNLPFDAALPSGTYQVFVSAPANPATGTGAIAESLALTFKAGEAAVTYTQANPQTAPAGGEVAVNGKLALEDGTALAARTVTSTFTRGTVGTDPVKDAGIRPAAPDTALVTSRTFTTAADGTVSLVVDDPAETPQGTEIGGVLSTGGGVFTAGNLTINFASSTPVAGSVVTVQGFATTVRAGEISSGTVTVTSPTGVGGAQQPAEGQIVTLTLPATSGAYFTDGTPAPAPVVGADAGTFTSLGKSITVTTGAGGVTPTVRVSNGRDAGFDDDGLASATVTASVSASASATATANFTSFNPLNGGTIVLTEAAQQDNPVNPTPTTGEVDYDVKLKDQFGNNVGNESFSVTTPNPDADVTGSFVSDFDAAADISVSSDVAGDVTFTANWTTDTFRYTTATGTGNPTTGTETVTASVTESFYNAAFGDNVFTLTANAAEPVAVGTAVTETVKVVDSEGNPVEGLRVEFFRTGPDAGGGDANVVRFTNVNGEAFYTFVGSQAGDARITATVTDGVEIETLTDTVTFGNAPGTDEPVVINATIGGFNNGARADNVSVNAPMIAAGAKVDLFKRVNGRLIKIRSLNLNANGRVVFGVRDLNGARPTSYTATVRANENIKQARTGYRSIR